MDKLLDQARAALAKGDHNRALALCGQALEADSADPRAIDLTHTVLLASDQPQAAEAVKQAALAQGIETDVTRRRLAQAAAEAGDKDRALGLLTRAHAADPGDRGVTVELARAYLDAGDRPACEDVISRFAQVDPDDARFALFAATFLADHGLPDAARPHIDRYASLTPEGPERDHRVAALSGAPPPDRPDPDYIAKVFDTAADRYDDNLAGLDNQGPQLLQACLNALVIDHPCPVLDAGCGTGLCADILRPLAAPLVGLDLSQRMLEKAQLTGAYDQLLQADLLAMPADLGPFGLIVCMDVLTYLGDLAPAIEALSQRVAPGGRLIAVVTAAPETGPDIVLEPSGRYRHRCDYVEGLAKSAGLVPLQAPVTAPIRLEYGDPILAHLFAYGRPE